MSNSKMSVASVSTKEVTMSTSLISFSAMSATASAIVAECPAAVKATMTASVANPAKVRTLATTMATTLVASTLGLNMLHFPHNNNNNKGNTMKAAKHLPKTYFPAKSYAGANHNAIKGNCTHGGDKTGKSGWNTGTSKKSLRKALNRQKVAYALAPNRADRITKHPGVGSGFSVKLNGHHNAHRRHNNPPAVKVDFTTFEWTTLDIPMNEITVWDRLRSDIYCRNRAADKAARRVANRARFTLDAVLALVARRHTKVAKAATGFTANFVVYSCATNFNSNTADRHYARHLRGVVKKAATKSAKLSNIKAAKAHKAEAARAFRLERKAARRLAKLNAVLAQRQAAKEQLLQRQLREQRAAMAAAAKAFQEAQRTAAVMALGVTPRGHRLATNKAMGITSMPVTRAMQSAALRGAHDGVKYHNGTEVPTPKAVVATRRAIARRDRNELPAALRFRQEAAEQGTKFHRSCRAAAGRALARGMSQVEPWITFSAPVPAPAPAPAPAPEVPVTKVKEKPTIVGPAPTVVPVQLDEVDVFCWLEECLEDGLSAYWIRKFLSEQFSTAEQAKVEHLIPEDVEDAPAGQMASSALADLMPGMDEFLVTAGQRLEALKEEHKGVDLQMCWKPEDKLPILRLINLQYGVNLTNDEWESRKLSKERCEELGVRSPKLSKAMTALGIPADRVATLLSGKAKKSSGVTTVYGDDYDETALWDQGNSIHYSSCQATDVRSSWGDDTSNYAIDGDQKYWGESLFIWATGQPMSVDGEGFTSRAKLRICYTGNDVVAGLYIDRPYGQYNLLLDNINDLKQWWATYSEERGYPKDTPLLMPPLWQRDEGVGTDFQSYYEGRYSQKLVIPSANGGYQDTLGGGYAYYDFFVDLGASASLTTQVYKARGSSSILVWDKDQNPINSKKVWMNTVKEVLYNPQKGIEKLSYEEVSKRTGSAVKLGKLWVEMWGYPQGKLQHTLGTCSFEGRDVSNHGRITYSIHDVVTLIRSEDALVVVNNFKSEGFYKAEEFWVLDLLQLATGMIKNAFGSDPHNQEIDTQDSLQNQKYISVDKDVYRFSSKRVSTLRYNNRPVLVYTTYEQVEGWDLDPDYEFNCLEVKHEMPDIGFHRPMELPYVRKYGVLKVLRNNPNAGYALAEENPHFVDLDILVKTEAIMAGAKEKYGAGDLQMCLKPVNSVKISKKAEGQRSPGLLGAKSVGAAVNGFNADSNEVNMVPLLNSETNSSSFVAPQNGEGELSMIDKVEAVFGNSITKAVSVHNNTYSQEPLGYAMGIAMVYVSEEGDLVHGNINLPIRNNYSYSAWSKLGEPLYNENETLNFSSLVTPAKDHPVISLRAATQSAAGGRQSMFYMSNNWHRPNLLLRGKPEVQPNLWFPGVDGVVKPSNVIEGKTVKERLGEELLATRTVVHKAIVSGSSLTDEFGNVVESFGGLDLQVGRNIIFFVAEVGNYLGLDNSRQLLFNVRMENGNVVGSEGLVEGAFNHANGALYGKQLTYTRLITNKLNLYKVNNLAGISGVSDWSSVDGAGAGLVFNKDITKALAELFFAGNPLIAPEQGTFAAWNIRNLNFPTEDAKLLMNMLDMNPGNARAFNSGVNVKPAVDKTVYKKQRVVTPEVTEVTEVAEPVQEVTNAAAVIAGVDAVETPAAAPVVELDGDKVETPAAAPVVELGEDHSAEPVVEAPAVESPVDSYANQLANYNKAVSTRWVTKQFAEVDIESFKLGKPWAESAQVIGLGDKNVICKADTKHLGAFAVQRYLAAVTGAELFDAIDFSGYLWTVKQVEDIISILLSYQMTAEGKAKLAQWHTDDEGNQVLAIYGLRFTFVDGIGVLDRRGRLFKNLLEVVYLDEGEGRQFNYTSCVNSIGAFLRLLYLGFLPLYSTSTLDEVERIGANLNSLINISPDLFPMTSDGIRDDNAMVLWAEASAWTPIGKDLDVSYRGFKKVGNRYAFLNCAGAMAKSLAKQYTLLNKSVKLGAAEMAESFVTHALENWSLVSSFNKGCLFGATGFFTDVRCLQKTAPMVYRQLVDEVNAQCLANHKVSLESLAGVLKVSVSALMASLVVNNNQKTSKGTKRILLRAPNTIPSGNVVDLAGRPALAQLLADGHGIKPTWTKWQHRVHPDFYSVKTGSKLSYQKGHAEGTLLKVAIALTGVGPAGESVFIGKPERMPTGFNNKISQAEFVLAERCVDPESKSVKVGVAKKTALCPVTMDIPGCVLNGMKYTSETRVIGDTSYVYFIPEDPIFVEGDGVSTVCGVLTDNEDAPVLPVQHEKRNGGGILEWVRYHIAPSLTTDKELELESSVTWNEAWPKIRSVIVKSQILAAEEAFVVNGLNPKVNTSLVDIVYLNDAVKADTMVSMVGTIGATLVYNPDTTDAKFEAMRQLAMDINEEVEGRRHLEYLVEDSTAVAANPKYRKLFGMFRDYFLTTMWTNWQQLEHGDFGQGMLQLYEDLVALRQTQLAAKAKDPEQKVTSSWVELTGDQLNFLANAGFARKDGRFLSDIRCFIDTDLVEPTTNIFVFTFKNGKVSSIKQRCISLVGKDNTPIYDVVMYERSTNKEGVNNNPAGQMDVNIRSVKRVTEAAGINTNGFVDTLMSRQAESGKQVSMMHAKFLNLMLSSKLSTAMPAATVIKLGAWVTREDSLVPEFKADPVAVATVKQLLVNVDMQSLNHFGEICSVFRNYVFQIDSPRDEFIVEELNGEQQSVRVTRSVEVWTPFLYNLNGLTAENNSHNTISGFFRDYLLAAINGKQPKLVSQKLIGMLDSFARSESVRKFISGDQTVGGKILAMPNCPTSVLLLTEHSDQWKKVAQQARAYGVDLRNVPSWDEYKEHGEAVWDVLEDRAEVFNHETRSPLADGSIVRIVKLPASGKFFKGFYYSSTELYQQAYENGKPVGKPQFVKPYPYTRGIGTVAHTGMNKGDSDGDPTVGVILTWFNEVEKQALRVLLTSFDFAWTYCEESVGGKGKMAERGLYLGDHLAAPKASKKLAVYSQSNWLAINAKPVFEEGDSEKVIGHELVGVGLIERFLFNRNNFRALIMQQTFVGAAYRVYRIAEALFDMVNNCPSADFKLPAALKWCRDKDAAEVVKAVTELYEIILGATDDDGWALWQQYYLPVCKGQFPRLDYIEAFSLPAANPELAALEQNADYAGIRNKRVAGLKSLMDDMGANSKYADQVLYCLWYCSILANVAKSEAPIVITAEAGEKRNFEFLLMAAYMSVEAGRAKWAGYKSVVANQTTWTGYNLGDGALNDASVGDKKKARQQDVTRLVSILINKPSNADFFSLWASRSHTMTILSQLTDAEVLGDLIAGNLEVTDNGTVTVINKGYTLAEETLQYYQDRLTKRVGDIVIPEVIINELLPDDDDAPAPYDYNEEFVVYAYDDDDLSYLDSCPDYDDGYQGPNEDDLGDVEAGYLNTTPPDLDSGHIVDEEETMELNNELPPEEDSFTEEEDSDLNNEPLPDEDYAIAQAALRGVDVVPTVEVAVDEPVEVPTAAPVIVVDYDDEDDLNNEPLPEEDYITAQAALQGKEEGVVEEATSAAPVAPRVVEAVATPAAAPVVAGTELEEILAETASLEDEIKALKVAVAKQEAEDKVLAEAKTKRDALKSERDALKGKLRNKYLAEVYGNRGVTPDEPVKEDKGDDDKDGGAPVVVRKPNPKPPTTPPVVAKEEPKAAPVKEEKPVAKQEVTPASTTATATATTDLYTGSSAKDGQGGWAVCTEDGTVVSSGSESNTTCNAMSLKSVLEALKVAAAGKGKHRIYCPNTYVLVGVLSNSKQKANLELWEQVRSVWSGIKGRTSIFKGNLDAAKAAAKVTPIAKEENKVANSAPVSTQHTAPANRPMDKREPVSSAIWFNSATVNHLWLSNFFICSVSYNGHQYDTAEAAYQLAKCAQPTDEQYKSFTRMHGAAAKTAGRKLTMRPDWDKVKDQVMYDILSAKFSNPELKARLLDTGDVELIHLVTWNDFYWGRNKEGKGLNRMGEILMRIRKELCEDHSSRAALNKAVMEVNDQHIQQLGWDLTEAKAQLKALHGVTSRQELTNGQLVEWSQYCEVLAEEQAEKAKKHNKKATQLSNNMQVVNIHKGGTGHYIGRAGKGQKGTAMTVTKVISGGQTGADLGGLLGATLAGIPTGGHAPKGFKTEQGVNPQLAKYGLAETQGTDYVYRTKLNIDNADATVAFQWDINSVGTARTIGYCQSGNWCPGKGTKYDGHRPVLSVTTKDVAEAAAQVKEFIQKTGAKTLNIAGNRESKAQGLQQFVTEVISMTLSQEAPVKKLQEQKRPLVPSTNTTVNTTARSTIDRSTVALPVSAQHTPCQQRFFDVVVTGKDIFLSGAPGTGKTYATEQIARHWLSLGDKVIVTATTGRAVMNLGSMFKQGELTALGTVNSVLKLGIGFDEKERKDRGIKAWNWANTLVAKGSSDKRLASLLKSAKNGQKVHFILDEVSMLDARLLWVIVSILRAHNPAIQILLVGDGNQLQPVSKKEDPSTPFWKTPEFVGCAATVNRVIEEFTVVNLVTNVRQAQDPSLKEALDHLARTNELSGVLLERLNGCLNGTIKPPADVDCTHIRYNNITVERINKDHTDALQTEKKVYKATIQDNTGSFGVPNWVNEFSPIGVEMELGVGMPIKLRRNRKGENDALEASNGSRGIITKLGKSSVWVRFENDVVLEVKPETFEGSNDSKGNSKGTFKQLPLHPDYATTGHSCQGLTIKNAVVIGVYQERRVFAKGKPVLDEQGKVKTYKCAISDAEWILVACSRVERADQIFFDVEDPNIVNLIVSSMGNKDESYFQWLEGTALS